MLTHQVFPVHPSLHSVIQHYALIEAQLPDGMTWSYRMIPTMQEWIFFNLADPQPFVVQGHDVVIENCTIACQYTEAFHAALKGHVKLFGVNVKSPGVYRFFNTPLSSFFLRLAHLEQLIGIQTTKELMARLRGRPIDAAFLDTIDSFFINLMSTGDKVNPNVVTALSMIRESHGNVQVRDLALATKMTERGLQKSFLREVGITPKEYSKLQRFNRSVQIMLSSTTYSWKEIVHDLGYYDQSHYINDFRSITGTLPSEYFVDRPDIQHFFSGIL